MAGDASLELQTALYERLSTDATLSALVTGVFDHVPSNTNFPYITLGDETAIDWSTCTHRGQSSTVTIHTWSRDHGRQRTKQIMDAIYECLHEASFDLVDHHLVSIRFEFSETLPDADNVTYHGIQRFRVYTHEGA